MISWAPIWATHSEILLPCLQIRHLRRPGKGKAAAVTVSNIIIIGRDVAGNLELVLIIIIQSGMSYEQLLQMTQNIVLHNQ